ncbi:MAG: serine/threonine-protein kinase, partial [Myxococcota bacterium]
MTHRDETIRSAPARSCIDVAGGHDGGTPQPRFGDRYRNARFIGAGGMGQVFRVYDAVLERDVALKSLSETATPKAHARFSREATTTAGLGHPGIVTVYDKGSFDGAPYYTMELLTGGRWDPADGTALRTQLERLAHVCAAVGFANERAVVHRDLKPANVLMSEHGDLVVVDWGLARVGAQPEGPETTVPSDASVTRQGDLLGTPLYMSPEQARGEPTDARADVWALGMMLLELLSKEHPFAGLRSAEIVERLAANDVPSARSYLPTTAPELLAVVERATSTHRSERYASSTALSEDLRRYLDGRRVRAFTYSKRDALRRVYKAFGPLINVSVAATLGTVAIAGWAWSRTAAERDRALLAEQTALTLEQRARSAERAAVAEKATADAVSKRLLAEQARAALDSGDVARAESRAEASLALGASPDARGVVMQTSAMPRAELLHSYPRPCPTATLSSAGQSILCKDEESVSVFDAADGREVLNIVDLPADGVVLLDDSTAVLTWGNGPRAAAYELGDVYSLESVVPSVSASTLRQPSEPVEGYHEMLERIVATATCRAGLPKLAVEVGRRV